MIRLLVALLLVANVLLFLYGLFRGGPATGSQRTPPRPPDVGSLRVLEARVLPAPQPAEPAQPPASVARAEAPATATEARAEPASTPAQGDETRIETAEPGAETTEPQAETAESGAEIAQARMDGPQTAPVAPTDRPPAETVPPVQQAETAGAAPSPQNGAVAEAAPAAEASVPSASPAASGVVPAASSGQETAPEAAATRNESRCGTLGPFASRRAARAVQARLPGEDRVTLELRPTRVEKSYWVRIAPLPDRASAVAMERRLRKAGISDLWRVRKGEARHAISLGLYTRKAAAVKRTEDLRRRGFPVELRTSYEEQPRPWLVFRDLPPAALERLASAPLPPGVRLHADACPDSSAASAPALK